MTWVVPFFDVEGGRFRIPSSSKSSTDFLFYHSSGPWNAIALMMHAQFALLRDLIGPTRIPKQQCSYLSILRR